MEFSELQQRISQCEAEIGKEIIGQKDVVRTTLLALLTGGNVLLEGMPGLGKTRLVNTISKVVGLPFKRIQFTPDLMPTDVVGTSILNTQTQEFTFRKGPVFTQFLLVDEINRAPAKTQAALFECMEERQVTFDGKTYALPDFYMVMATQNPIDQEGTYRLPEAQMDRFLMKITVGYPSVESELKILQEYHQGNNLHEVKFDKPVITLDELKQMRSMLTQVVVDDSLMKYLCNIVAATRDSTYTWIGGSPRASIALLQTAKAHAILSGRDFVTPDDIHFLAPYILAHRVTLTAEAELNGMTITQLVKQIIDSVAIDN